MEDTQRSQPISPENQRIAEHAVLNNKRMPNGSESDNSPILVGQTSLEWIKVLARDEPDVVFTSLVHRINFHLLKQSFRKVRKSKSCGIDKVTAEEYAENLDANLYSLLRRL
jgi:RNA-directed DNA polymerase